MEGAFYVTQPTESTCLDKEAHETNLGGLRTLYLLPTCAHSSPAKKRGWSAFRSAGSRHTKTTFVRHQHRKYSIYQASFVSYLRVILDRLLGGKPVDVNEVSVRGRPALSPVTQGLCTP